MKPLFIDHIVLIAKDVKETEKFYSTFLSSPEYVGEDSISYKVGETKIFFALANTEWATQDKDAGGLNHLAFGVKSVEELKKFESKLNESNIKNSGVQIDKYGGKEFIWFNDPNGYRLEFYLRTE